MVDIAPAAPHAADATELVSEDNAMQERVVICPCDGRFVPLPAEVFTTEGEWVEVGTALAEIHTNGTAVTVRSAFRGWLMGMLAMKGQPVRQGQALFWVRP